MTAGFNISPDEIDALAKAVDAATSTLGASVAAANQRMGSEAFGLIGVGLAAWCDNVMQEAAGTLKEAHAAGERHSAAVRDWAESQRVNEESIKGLFDGGGQG